jgi:hypothetical protein
MKVETAQTRQHPLRSWRAEPATLGAQLRVSLLHARLKTRKRARSSSEKEPLGRNRRDPGGVDLFINISMRCTGE